MPTLPNVGQVNWGPTLNDWLKTIGSETSGGLHIAATATDLTASPYNTLPDYTTVFVQDELKVYRKESGTYVEKLNFSASASSASAPGSPDPGDTYYNTTDDTLYYWDGTSWVSLTETPPAGADTQIQFNNAGSFGSNANFVWDKTNQRLGVGTSSPTQKLEVNGQVKIGAYTLPSTDGSANQVLKTNGSGIITWQNEAGGSLVVQSLAPTGTTQTIDWNNGQIVLLSVTGATGNVTLTLNNPQNGDYLIKVTQGATARNIIFPVGTIQGNGVSGNTVFGLSNSTQMITVSYYGTGYAINVDVYA